MNEWETLQKIELEEMKKYHIGRRVRLTWMHKPEGEIIAASPPIGLLAAKYKCLWDDNATSGWLGSRDLELV